MTCFDLLVGGYRGRVIPSVAVLLLAAGCRESVSEPSKAAVPPAVPVEASAPTAETPGRDGSPAGSSADDKRPGTKWIGDIPYDVFYDDPLSVAAEERTIGEPEIATATIPSASMETGGPIAASRTETTMSDGSGSAEAAALSVNWQRLATAETLNDEIKQIRGRLTTNLRTVGAFNRNLQAIADDAVTLAVIAAVVEVHPDPLTWQKNARAVRDLATKLAAESAAPGRQAYLAAQTPFEQLTAILDGASAADDGAAVRPFSDVAGRNQLMRRIERSFNWLKSEVDTEARFRSSPERVVREASLLALLGGIVSTESYDLTDEPSYRQYVGELVDGGVRMAEAARLDSFAEFITARDRVQNSCAACHGEFALGAEGL